MPTIQWISITSARARARDHVPKQKKKQKYKTCRKRRTHRRRRSTIGVVDFDSAQNHMFAFSCSVCLRLCGYFDTNKQHTNTNARAQPPHPMSKSIHTHAQKNLLRLTGLFNLKDYNKNTVQNENKDDEWNEEKIWKNNNKNLMLYQTKCFVVIIATAALFSGLYNVFNNLR